MKLKYVRNLDEFHKLSKSKEVSMNGINGLYCKGIIWTRKLSFKTIFHEVVHHILKFPHNKDLSCSLMLFFDCLNDVHDAVNNILFYRTYNIHEVVNVVKESWNDFLDFQLCRDVGV